MKTTTVWLVDHQEAVLDEALKRNHPQSYFSVEEIKEAISYCVEEEYRYNKSKGKTYCKFFGMQAEYIDKEDLPKYESNEEAARWEFTNFVRNEASRKKKNYR